MEMMWGKDRRGLESALHIAQRLVVKSFSQTAANPNHLLIGNWSTLISHLVQAAAGGGGGGRL